MEHQSEATLQLSATDLDDAVAEGVLSDVDVQRLQAWAATRKLPAPDVEKTKGFNLVTVAYYFGAMLMISACAWFLGDKWDILGSAGVLATTLIYFAVALTIGWWLRSKGYLIGGGLLIIVVVCLVPLITYCIEDLTGFWPDVHPGKYKDFYPWIHGSWIAMEIATIIAAGIALKFVRFGFLTAPLAFSFWFLSMDLASLILGHEDLDWNTRAWIGVGVGAITIAIGYLLERVLHRRTELRSEDFAFWCFLFGILAFWGCLTSMDSDSETGKFLYLLVNIGLIAIALFLRRAVFLIFGALGVHLYIGHLAYVVFKDSFLFPFVIAFLGLSLILVTVFAQAYLRRINNQQEGI